MPVGGLPAESGVERSSAPPRVLWLAHTAPGPRLSGRDVYSGGLLTALADTGAAVTFVGLRHPDGPGSGTGRLGEPARPCIDWRIVEAAERGTVPALASRLPLVAARASPPAIVSALQGALREKRYDAVVFDNYAAGWALDIVEAEETSGALRVYVAHNDEAQLATDIARAFSGDPLRTLALRLNVAKTRRLEDRLLRRANLLVVLTEDDRDRFVCRSPRLQTLVVPPGYAGPRVPARRITPDQPRRVAMVGSIRWVAKRMNVAAFLAEADSRFAAAGITLDIIGDVPDDFRAEWEPRLRATRFRGFVDDLAGAMATTRLGLVIEATGGGFKLKTLDYIFNRLPVAALAGSCAGFPRAIADAFLLAADAAALTDAVIAAIDDLPRLNAMQEAAFAAADSLFDWPTNGRRLLDALAAPHPSPVRLAREGDAVDGTAEGWFRTTRVLPTLRRSTRIVR